MVWLLVHCWACFSVEGFLRAQTWPCFYMKVLEYKLAGGGRLLWGPHDKRTLLVTWLRGLCWLLGKATNKMPKQHLDVELWNNLWANVDTLVSVYWKIAEQEPHLQWANSPKSNLHIRSILKMYCDHVAPSRLSQVQSVSLSTARYKLGNDPIYRKRRDW